MKKTAAERSTMNATFLVGLFMIVSTVVVAVAAPLLTSFTFDGIDATAMLRAPDGVHPLGTDHLGRDSLTRIAYGSRIALRVGLIAVVIETLLGVTLGLIAGFYGGIVEKIISFITDLTWAIPPLILALAIVTVLGPSLNNVIIAVSVVSWAQFSRIVRAKTQSLRSLPYVEAARAYGENDFSLIVRYILPNIVPSIIVVSTLSLPKAIIATTALGFLGLGAQPPAPDWGVMLAEGVNYLRQAPWISIYPGLAIVFVVLGFNLLGEGLRDTLDPRMRL